MSDSKWRKLLSAIRNSEIDLNSAVIKFIDVDQPKKLAFNNHWPAVLADTTLDTIDFGPVTFREIEWLEFPSIVYVSRPNNLPAKEVDQDVEALKIAIENAGRFPLVFKNRSLRIVGYTN